MCQPLRISLGHITSLVSIIDAPGPGHQLVGPRGQTRNTSEVGSQADPLEVCGHTCGLCTHGPVLPDNVLRILLTYGARTLGL